MTPPSSPVTVHFLQLSDASAEELRQNPDLHRVLWQLTDLDRPPLPLDETPTTTMTWPGIAEGDLVVFPALLTGAGEFEGMKFVGPKSAIVWSTDDGGGKGENHGATRTLPLLTAGIEYPEFPVLVANMAKGRNLSLEGFDVGGRRGGGTVLGGSAHGEEEGTGGTTRWECQWKWKFQSVEYFFGGMCVDTECSGHIGF